jgi:hypothetical protein
MISWKRETWYLIARDFFFASGVSVLEGVSLWGDEITLPKVRVGFIHLIMFEHLGKALRFARRIETQEKSEAPNLALLRSPSLDLKLKLFLPQAFIGPQTRVILLPIHWQPCPGGCLCSGEASFFIIFGSPSCFNRVSAAVIQACCLPPSFRRSSFLETPADPQKPIFFTEPRFPNWA